MAELRRTESCLLYTSFVPVVGGVGSPYQIEEGYHSNDIAKGFAMKFHGKAMQFFAPAMFDDPKVMQGFLKEKPVREVVSVFKKLKTVIMGIGTTTAKMCIRDSFSTMYCTTKIQFQ